MLAGVFVHVLRDPREKPLLGFLPSFLFETGLQYEHAVSAA